MSKLDTILSVENKKKFAERYECAPREVRSLLDELVAMVQSKHPDVSVYPTDKPDLRFVSGVRVCATMQIRKHAPFIKIDLLGVKGALPGTSLEFRNSGDTVLKSYVYLSDFDGITDGIKYINAAISNSKPIL